MVERLKANEVSTWKRKVEKLQCTRDRLVVSSIPGGAFFVSALPVFVREASRSIAAGGGFKNEVSFVTALAFLSWYVPFKSAEFVENDRLKFLGNLKRAGEDIEPMIDGGRFPWVRKAFRGEVN